MADSRFQIRHAAAITTFGPPVAPPSGRGRIHRGDRRDRRGTRRGDDRERIGLPSPGPFRPALLALSPSPRSRRSPRWTSGLHRDGRCGQARGTTVV